MWIQEVKWYCSDPVVSTRGLHLPHCHLQALLLQGQKGYQELGFILPDETVPLSQSFYFLPHCMACGISLPQPGTEPWLQQWKPRILTTRPPGNFSQELWYKSSLDFLCADLYPFFTPEPSPLIRERGSTHSLANLDHMPATPTHIQISGPGTMSALPPITWADHVQEVSFHIIRMMK